MKMNKKIDWKREAREEAKHYDEINYSDFQGIAMAIANRHNLDWNVVLDYMNEIVEDLEVK